MTTTEMGPEIEIPATPQDPEAEKEKRKRRLLLALLLLLLLICCCLGYFIVRYLLKPEPLPDMLPPPVVEVINIPPTYKYSIAGVDGPIGVAVSPDGERVYVAESRGERLVKMFDRDGNLIKGFAPHGTTASTRQPRYLAVDASGRVYLTDRLNNAIQVFDADGNYLDAIIAPDMTLTKLLSTNIPGGVPPGTVFFYEGINHVVFYQLPDQTQGSIQVVPSSVPWGPLGLTFDALGNLMYTDITAEKHSVHIIPAASLNAPLSTFNPVILEFGAQGKEAGQFDFPNDVVTDSRGSFYVSDGNNGRISSWAVDMKYRAFFGFGSGGDALNLPRGMWMDAKDHLHVADAVGATIRVYDVSGEQPKFLYSFGAYGLTEGLFAFPNDITIDGTGRLYITDRENNRIQVWSY